MTWVDVVIVLLIVASGAFGFWRGFAKESIAVVTWLAAIWLAWRSAWMVEPVLGDWDAAPELRVWVARGLIFVAILIVGGLIAWLLRAVIRSTGLSSTDRSLGALFGLARGVLVVGLLTIVVELSGLAGEAWWQGSTLRPFGEQVAAGIRYYVEIGGRYIREQELAQVGSL
jgi:membrane protein required for colicin V production